MKLKTIVVIVGLIATGTSFAATSQDKAMQQKIKSLQKQVASLQSQVNNINTAPAPQSSSTSTTNNSLVQLNTALTSQLMGNFGGVDREMAILNAKSSMPDTTLYLGGYTNMGLTWDRANNEYTDSSSGDTVSKSNTTVSLDHAAVDFLANLNQYVATYVQLGANDIARSDNANDGNISFQQAYALFGNANLPVYGFAGIKDIDFGSFQTVNMFAQPLTRELFQATGNTAGVGYKINGFNAVVSVMNGGANGNIDQYAAGFWGSGYPDNGIGPDDNVGLYTQSGNQLNNFAVNTSYSATAGQINWKVGAGYLNGFWGGNTFANGGLSTNGNRIGAWDFNGQMAIQNWTLLGEFTTTAQKIDYASWGGGEGRLMAWDLGTQYAFNAGVIPNQSVVSFDYSGARQDSQTPVNENQFVLGARNQIWPTANVWAGVEYAYDHFTGGTGGGLNNNNVRLDLTANF